MAKKSRSKAKNSNTIGKILPIVLVLAFVGFGATIIIRSFAAKGGPSTNPYNLAVELATKDNQGNDIQGDKNGDGKINYGDTVHYTFTWPNNGEVVQAETQCMQNGTLVLTYLSSYGRNGTYKDSPFPWTQDILLGSSTWGSLGGGATCTAKLESLPAVKPGKSKITNLGSITYTVNP